MSETGRAHDLENEPQKNTLPPYVFEPLIEKGTCVRKMGSNQGTDTLIGQKLARIYPKI